MTKGRYSKLLTFLLAFSMILSMHVSFANPNEDLGDPYVELAKFEWKGNSWDAEGSSGGVTITSGSAIEVSFTSDEPVFAVLIKGGTDTEVIYFNGVYSGSFDNNDLELPNDNNPGSPGLSNIKFYTMHLGDITIEKIVEDEEGVVLDDNDTEFKFMIEMKVDGVWEEIDDSPVTITGNDTETLSGLLLGEYRITEIDIDSDYTLEGSNGLEVELVNNEDSEYASFTNIMDTPEDGSLRIIKSVETPGQASEIADTTEFSFIVEMYDEDAEEWVELEDSPFTVAGGSYEDLNLPLGKYRVTEESEFGYRLDSENELEVELTENDPTDSVLFTNVKIPDGMLTITKSVVTPGQASEIVDTTEFSFMVEMYDEDAEEWVELEDSPFVVAGGSSLGLDLPLGQYRVTEESKTGYILNSENGLEVELTENEPEDSVLFENIRIPQGEIEISKALVDEDDEVIDDDDTEFEFMIEMMVEEDEVISWVEIDESPVLLEGGEFETIIGLPLGEYRITEVNIPEGYELHMDTDNPQEVTLETDGDMGEVMFTNVREDDTPPPPELGEIEVIKIVQNRFGNGISSSTEFFFELQELDEDEDWITVDEGSILGNGTLTFDDLEDGLYRVREVSINSAYRLFSDNNIEADIVEGSSEEVEFTNRLRPPVDDEDEDRPPRRNDDDDVTVVESETVTPDPVPQAPPVIEIVQPEPEPEPEVEVVEEATPQATLPATGASDPTVIAGFGAAFMALGLYLKKKRF